MCVASGSCVEQIAATTIVLLQTPVRGFFSNRRCSLLSVLYVELEGVEPSSKRGNHTLSTRLVIGKIFEYMQDRDNQHIPYPLKFRRSIEACND